MWQAMFSFTNAVVLIAWLILAFLPRKPLAMTAVLYLGAKTPKPLLLKKLPLI